MIAIGVPADEHTRWTRIAKPGPRPAIILPKVGVVGLLTGTGQISSYVCLFTNEIGATRVDDIYKAAVPPSQKDPRLIGIEWR